MFTNLRRIREITLVLFLISWFAPAMYADESLAIVPFVGCPGDGQLGPVATSPGKPKGLHLSAPIAAKLAWYEYRGDAGQIGVLAPRGWNCFATLGSNGISLYVAPELLNAGKLLANKNWHGFKGPSVQLSESEGGTSGRFEVATVIARVFPAHRGFVRDVIAEGIRPASDFPSGAFPTDRVTYKGKELVEFVTPAHHKGLGTLSWLLPSDQPISGMAQLSTEGDMQLLKLDVRLPANIGYLNRAILEQAELE